MLDALRRRSSAAARATAATTPPRPAMAPPVMSPPPPPRGSPKPYEVPIEDGSCRLFDLPDEVLTRIFTSLDRVSLTRCFRLCKSLNELLSSNSSIALHHTLICNSLTLNPHVHRLSSNLNHIPPSSSRLLSTLRERLTRFRNLQPKSTSPLEFREAEGNLYEYLEGMLLRGIGRRRGGRSTSHEIAFYDIRKLGDWEDEPSGRAGEASGQSIDDGAGEGDGEDAEMDMEETTESEAGKDVRTVKSFGFEISEFAVDPGLDLLVLVEVKPASRTRYTMVMHLISLSTFEPHPMARQSTLEWPEVFTQPRISLGFQICDDGLFILKHNTRGGPHDQVCGWQWTTGRLAVVLKAFPTMSFESFVLLSPSSFVIPTIITHLDPLSDTQDELDNPSDLSWTHHLHLYAFPPLSSVTVPENKSEPLPPPHTAIHIATLDMPYFHVDIFHNIPPVRLTIRTDPPPRHTFPAHPVGAVSQFVPNPDSGVIVMEVHCQLPDDEPDPHYVMILHKSTLAQYLPAPTSPLLLQAFPRPAPVVPWETLAPHIRMLGPDLIPSSWVCYVYQDRYVTPHVDVESGRANLRLYDFDPLRVRKELYDRASADGVETTAAKSAEVIQGATTSPSTSPTQRRGWFGRRNSSFDSGSNTTTAHALDGDRDGIVLVTAETVLPRNQIIPNGLKTGGHLPYIYAERPTTADVALIDGERIIAVENRTDRFYEVISTDLEVMEF